MPTYKVPLKDTLFLLHDVFHVEQNNDLSGFSDMTPDTTEAILGEAGKLCEEVLFPLNQPGDHEGCVRGADGAVTTPRGFKAAYKQFSDGGWNGLAVDEAYGGQGLPKFLNNIVHEFTYSANFAWGLYPLLSQGAYAALRAYGSNELKDIYLPKLASGKWTGTMNLTEAHAGTDLGLLRTKAAAQSDGSYKITGQKIFISAGEHDLTENIVHLVLARIEGAPEGTKGISMFVVPKFMPDTDGNPGERNGVSCGSVEDKMGIHGNSTCTMNYDAATGWLVGDKHRGLAAMFVMMNEARLSVGIQGLGISEVAYQNAVSYAKDRLQGRRFGASKDATTDPIIVHPDVRRMLMDIRAFNEAARALMVWTSLKADVLHRSESETLRQNADECLGLMTPVIKGVFTDAGFHNAVLAQQVYGGHGYIAEWGMEQFVRDARIAMIYEGTNGIQALDLVGRKLPKDNGKALQALLNEIEAFLENCAHDEQMASFVAPLHSAMDDLKAATTWLVQNAIARPENAGAAATEYMHLLGLVSLGYMWGLMADAAQRQLNEAAADAAFLEAKLTTGRYFMTRSLVGSSAHLARIQSGSETLMSMPVEAF